MNILIIYATNSGSTFLVSDHIAQQLRAHSHQVTLQNIIDTQPGNLLEYDIVFLGSNSWDFEHKEGQPHHAFMKFLEGIQDWNLTEHRYVVFGCGDKSYQYFCGALDVISQYVETHQGKIIHEPLKINQFFFHDPDEVYKQVDEWLSDVETKF